MPVEVSQFIYGNSLVNFAGGSAGSNVPYWLSQFSEAADNTYAVNGGYGFLRQFADRDEPSNEWGFQGVDGIWDTDVATFEDVSFNSVIIAPGNFIQGLAPNEPYPGDVRSPLEATIDTVRDTLADQPDAQIYIYEGWADLGSLYGFPVSEAQLDEYHEYNAGTYHDWYVQYVQGINDAVPEANVQLIPVASTMAELFTDGPLQGLSLEDLYVDSAPHGTETVYFLASMVTYQETFGELPPADFVVPDTINPLVADNFEALNTQIAELLDAEETGGGTPPVVTPNSDPVVEGEFVEITQDEVAVVDVLANDSDPDLDTLSLQSVGPAENGTVGIVDGRAVYTPDDGFVGADGFTYIVTDNEGGFVEGRVDLQIEATETEPEPEEPVTEPEEPVTEPEEPVTEPEEPVTEPEEPVTEPETPPVAPVAGTGGFAVSYFTIADDITNLSDVDFDAEPSATGSVDALQYLEVSGSFAPEIGEDNFASLYTSELNVTEAGWHEVFLFADDFARVIVDGEVVIDTSDTDAGNLSTRWIDFAEGPHQIEVQYIEIDGEQSLNLDWAGPSTGGDIEAFVGNIPTATEVPVEPVEPEAPVEPVEPEPPVEPETPVEPEPPVAPVEPVPPVVVPEEPEAPVEPELPVEPTPPVVPEEPDAAPQTAFAATAIETNATSLNNLDFAAHAGVSQITNGVTLASEDAALLEGGPSDGAVQFTTQIAVEAAGLYEIGLSADDLAQVKISGLPVVRTDAADDGAEQSNSIFLTAGNHSVEVRYLDTGGAQSLDVTWSGPDTDGEVLPIGDTATDVVMTLFSDDVATRSDEEAFAIAMNEAEDEDFVAL